MPEMIFLQVESFEGRTSNSTQGHKMFPKATEEIDIKNNARTLKNKSTLSPSERDGTYNNARKAHKLNIKRKNDAFSA